MSRVRRILVIGSTAALLLLVGGVVGLRSSTPDSAAPAPAAPPDRLAAGIAQLQDRLRLVPGDYVGWAALGSAYVERARVTADPTYYPKAEGALRHSIALRPSGNAAAHTGLGALANARHDFGAARGYALDALRLNPYDADAYGVLADAQTQLGNADAASEAVQHMLDLRPGLAALARASYDHEQRGRTAEAVALMSGALDAAVDRSDVAFCRYQLGELAFATGDLAGAGRQYAAGLAADPAYLPLRAGRARVVAAQGRLDAAIADLGATVQAMPTPTALLEYAELLRVAGRGAEADTQVKLAAAAQQLFDANGGTDDLTGAALALAQGRPADALALAEREWQRRQFADVADTMAWALHANGRDTEALSYARRAAALGAANARYAYHLGTIELALGDRAAARRDLARALDINPYFSLVDGPLAARTLAGLESSS